MSGVNPVGIGLFPPAALSAAPADIAAALAAMFPGWEAAGMTLNVTTFSLSVAQRQALTGTPVLVVPGAAGELRAPLIMFNRRSTGAAGAAATGVGSVRQVGSAGGGMTSTFQLCSPTPNQQQFDMASAPGTISNAYADPAFPEGRGLEISGSSQVTGAGSTFDSWLFWLSWPRFP